MRHSVPLPGRNVRACTHNNNSVLAVGKRSPNNEQSITAGRRAVIKSSSRRWLHGRPGCPARRATSQAVCLCIAALGATSAHDAERDAWHETSPEQAE
jgi:hypothetical protein